MPRLLVTTFERLLQVDLGADHALRRVSVLHEGLGIYFGLAQKDRRIWVAERNLDIHKQRRVADAPVNGITLWRRGLLGGLRRTGATITDPSFDDLHQIAHDRGTLFVTTGRAPFLVRHDPATGRTVGVEIEAVLPDHLRRPDAANPDKYHFNSVVNLGGRLWVLAHNWDQPSFAVGMDLAPAREGRAENVQIVEGLGSCCHDVLPAFGALWVLDSGGAALVRVGPEGMTRYPVDGEGQQAFPRGLARMGDRLVLSYGFWAAEREARVNSASVLRVFDPVSEVMGPPMSLGQHGNTCAILAL